MNSFSLIKNKYLKICDVDSEMGFSLVELIVAMVILILIVFAFTPLFVGSIDRIYFAGDKTEALYQGQSDLEVDIAERITVDGLELVFTFGNTEVIVPGRLVEAEVTKGRATAWLSGFVPIVPTINLYLAPLPLVEGYDDTPIVVMGNSTDFPMANSQGENFLFYDNTGTEVSGHAYPVEIIEPPTGVPEDYDEYAEFTLKKGLTNEGSIYRIVLNWTIENDIEVIVKSRLQVVLPYAVAVGSGQNIWVSPDARETWKYKSTVGEGLGNLNDIIWTGFEFLAVTSSGRIVTWRDSESISSTSNTYGTLYGAAYGGGKYVVVGDGGSIYNSANATSWNNVNSSGGNLQAVGWSGLDFIAVGSSGTILSSEDGSSWIDESPDDADSVTFKGVVYGSQWLAVGNDVSGNAVIYSKSGETWNELELWTGQIQDEDDNNVNSLPGLNDITYDGSRYIAVGDSGTLITSTDGTGTQWQKLSSEPETINNLNAIAWGAITDDQNYIIVGAGRTILTWTGVIGELWVLESSGISGITDTDNINSVAVRWTN